MISTKDGSMEFDSPKICFSRGMTLQSFLDSPFFSLFTLRTDLNPSFSYDFGPVLADDRTFEGGVWFYAGVILKLSLRIIQPVRPDGAEYFHRDYLRQILGYQAEGDYGSLDYKFPWGEIVAAEVKGAESDIWIHYVAV